MAEKRMFSKKIIDTDWFMDMPQSSQNLYFHLSMRADDDGFVSSPQRIIKMVGSSNDDYKLLVAKKFIIPFESGVCVIKDWRINNYLRNDRYTETIYKEEKSQLELKDNGEYEKVGIPMVYPVLSNSISNNINNINNNDNIKQSLDKTNTNNKSKKFVPPTLEEVKEYAKQRNSCVNPVAFYEFFTTDENKQWVDSNGKQIKNWKQKFLTWESFQNGNNKGKRQKLRNERTYTHAEMNTLFTSVDDVEI